MVTRVYFANRLVRTVYFRLEARSGELHLHFKMRPADGFYELPGGTIAYLDLSDELSACWKPDPKGGKGAFTFTMTPHSDVRPKFVLKYHEQAHADGPTFILEEPLN